MRPPRNENYLWLEPDFACSGLWVIDDGYAVPIFDDELAAPLRQETAARLASWLAWFETEYDPDHLWATQERKAEFEHESWHLWRMLRDDLTPAYEVGHRLLYERDFQPAQAELEYERVMGHPAYPAVPGPDVEAVIDSALGPDREQFDIAAKLAHQGDLFMDRPEWDVVEEVVSRMWVRLRDSGERYPTWDLMVRATLHLYDRCPTWWIASTLQDFWNDLPDSARSEFWSWSLVTLRRPRPISRPLANMIDVQWHDHDRPVPAPVASLLDAIAFEDGDASRAPTARGMTSERDSGYLVPVEARDSTSWRILNVGFGFILLVALLILAIIGAQLPSPDAERFLEAGMRLLLVGFGLQVALAAIIALLSFPWDRAAISREQRAIETLADNYRHVKRKFLELFELRRSSRLTHRLQAACGLMFIWAFAAWIGVFVVAVATIAGCPDC